VEEKTPENRTMENLNLQRKKMMMMKRVVAFSPTCPRFYASV